LVSSIRAPLKSTHSYGKTLSRVKEARCILNREFACKQTLHFLVLFFFNYHNYFMSLLIFVFPIQCSTWLVFQSNCGNRIPAFLHHLGELRQKVNLNDKHLASRKLVKRTCFSFACRQVSLLHDFPDPDSNEVCILNGEDILVSHSFGLLSGKEIQNMEKACCITSQRFLS